ncbi:MAG: LLM class flavin-dependent oxidoreductase, partial [Actinomycetota bacterium]|nr:LLM class flavin-dependent oxidoreductase [Actinomycetota bacterium]
VQDSPERGSLDAWATLAALAQVTDRLRLGTLVSPATFRHPSVLAKVAVTVDHVSRGRVEVGIGAGWHEPEHTAYGFPFPPASTRLEMLEEQIEIVHRSWKPGPFDVDGRHYRLKGLDAFPKPVQQPHPNLIVGGSGGARSVRLAARWADEYNTIFASPDLCRRRRQSVNAACEAAGRAPALAFSLMTGCIVGRDDDDVHHRASLALERRDGGGSVDDWLDGIRGEWIVGTVDEAVGRLREYEAAGVDRVMLQHQRHNDLAMVRLLGEIAAQLAG